MYLRGVRGGRGLPRIQVSRMDLVSGHHYHWIQSYFNGVYYREKGDASKGRDYLPADKQYLLTRGVPCLRRATSLAYTDADEDAERLVSFGDSSSNPGGEVDEWVETHAGRKSDMDSAANPGTIDDIPDLDGPQDNDNITSGIGSLSIGPGSGGGAAETPDLDDIPDMEEEDLEEGDEATATKPPARVIVARYPTHLLSLCYHILNKPSPAKSR
jgi:ubiquitin-like-conjugating enzyme ATG3